MVGYELKFSVKNILSLRDVIVEIFYGWATTRYFFIFFDTPENFTWNFTSYGNYDLPTGTYNAYAKAWDTMSGGFYVQDIVNASQVKVGEEWWNSTGSGLFDSETQEIVYTAAVEVDITNFNVTVPFS